MNLRKLAVAITAFLIVLPVPGVPARAGLPVAVGDTAVPSLAPMLKKATPAVVNIAARGRVRVLNNPLLADPFFRRFFNLPGQPRERRTQSVGSGVIVDAEKGYVLTNNHVIANAEEIIVTLRDRRQFAATLVGTDPETDIAVLQIPADGLAALPMGDSDKLEVGDFVVAIGNPFGIGQTVTSGIVSALRRSGLGIEGFEDFIQTDASINPGNSGGALVTLTGDLIGINTAIIGPNGGNVGIGFAIPINMVRRVMDQLVAYGAVDRGRLGIQIQDLTPQLADALDLEKTDGALITRIAPGSPADEAGLRAGDVVVKVDNQPVRNASQLRNALGLLRAGEPTRITVIRDGRERTLRAVLAKSKQMTVQATGPARRLAGATFETLGPDSPLYGRVEGVRVVAVERGSPAWRIGLRKNDVIVAVNREPVSDLDGFKAAVAASRGALLLNIQRGAAQVFIVVR